MTTVGVFGIQFNGWYEEYIEEWFESCLKAGFDQVLLVSDQNRLVPFGVDLFVAPPCNQKYPIPYFSNCAVKTMWTEWCWNMDIDDVISPSALREIRVIDADVYAAGMVTSDGVKSVYGRVDAAKVAQANINLINAGSAFKKSMWEKIGGYPDIGFHDWGLWRLMGRQNAVFAASGNVDYMYRRGHNSVSKNFDIEKFTEEVMKL